MLLLFARCAGGSWSDDIATTGFGSLAVVSNASYTSLAQLYSAGYVEAAFTHTRIAQHFTNVLQMQLDGAPDDAYTRTLAFYEAQYAWATSMIAAHADEPRWVALNLTFSTCLARRHSPSPVLRFADATSPPRVCVQPN